MSAVEYVARMSGFHRSRTIGVYASAAEAVRHIGCGECECGGGSVVARGSRADLEAAGMYESAGGDLVIDSPDAGHITCEVKS